MSAAKSKIIELEEGEGEEDGLSLTFFHGHPERSLIYSLQAACLLLRLYDNHLPQQGR